MSNLLTRRAALGLVAGTLGGVAGRLYAAPPGGARFLLVFLRGGYDAANLLVPYASPFYYESRPTIALSASRDSGALPLDADWALAPAVRGSLGALYQQRQLAFVPFAGTDDLSRSHFETQDSIELGLPPGAPPDYRSGFLGRLAQTLAAGGRPTPAIAFTDALPLAMRGPVPLPALSLAQLGPAPAPARARLLEELYEGQPLEPAVREGIELREQVTRTQVEEMQSAGRQALPTRGFERQAQRIAALMRDRYRIGFIDVAGWDTHVQEGGAEGLLAGNLAALGRGLCAYAQALGAAQWRDTCVVVISEFGRTFRENGDRGTDHGHGSVYWVLGGAVAGGRIAGAQQRVARETLFQDRDYPVLNDYRSLLGGLFRTLWQLPASRSAEVFPVVAPQNLGLV